MKIGVPKEIKNGETRVSLTPDLCKILTRLDCEVVVERGAGKSAGFQDREYRAAGARIATSAAAAWKSDLVLKVKEPLESEHAFLRKDLALFTYLHLAANPRLTRVLQQKRVLGIAYETVEDRDGQLPLLKPMSQIAGRLAVQVAAFFLQSANGGSGILLGGIPGTAPGRVTILGAGNSGSHACHMATGMGANVTVLDVDTRKLEQIDREYHGRVVTLVSNPYNLAESVKNSDVLIGAVLIPGSRAPTIVKRGQIAKMRPGSVVVDIAVDQGGCIETIHPTAHNKPTYMVHGVVHYAVPNMPALVARTSTIALTQATEPYIVAMARQGIETALAENAGLARGVNTIDGTIVNAAVAES